MRGNSQKAQRILRISTGARVDAREVPRSIPGSRLPVMQIDYIRLSRVILRIAAPVRFARCAAGERRSFDGKPTSRDRSRNFSRIHASPCGNAQNPLGFLRISAHNVYTSRPIPKISTWRSNHANQQVCYFHDGTALRGTCSKRWSRGCGSAFWDLEDEPGQVEIQPRTSTEKYHGKDRV